MRLNRIYFSTVALRLSAAIHHPVDKKQINMLVNCWNKKRERHDQNPIHFRQRVKDEVAWQHKHHQPINKERFFFSDELELFSRYVGYDLTQ